uniref:Uncharacterized protein n=1 Tax=Oryza nivara TaxID=4536 RepID=A0A0E0IIB9_ORYNI
MHARSYMYEHLCYEDRRCHRGALIHLAGAVYYTHMAVTVHDDFPRIVACTVRRTCKCKYCWQHTVRRDVSCAIRCALK